MVARSASPAFPPSGTGARSRTESGTCSGPKVRASSTTGANSARSPVLPGRDTWSWPRARRALRSVKLESGLAGDGAPHLGADGGVGDRGRAPLRDPHQAGLEQVESGEEGRYLAVGTRDGLLGHQLVEPVSHADHRTA